MGTILERPRKNGSICYQAMIKIPGGKAIVKSFDDIDLASRFIDAVESERESLQKLRESKTIKPSKPESVPAHARVARMESEMLSDAINTFRKTDKCLRRHRDTLNTILTHIAHIGDVTIGEVKLAWVKKYLRPHAKAKDLSRHAVHLGDSQHAHDDHGSFNQTLRGRARSQSTRSAI